jgi:hypothetical protein
MDSGEIEALIQCLVANPHDTDALARAHLQGEADPQGYAYLLEQVGTRTEDPAYASHWLSEAANIWSVTLGDAHRAARVLMIAVDRDPTQPLAADRLAQLYRDKGDVKALVAMLDRRVRLLTPMLVSNPASAATLRSLLATLHEELGKLWNDPPLEQPRKAIEHYKRSIELDPTSAFAIFSLREIYKGLQQWDEAISLYGMELALERAPERRLLLARDEAATRRLAGDLAGVTQVLRSALDEIRGAGSDDPVLAQEVAGTLLDRAEAGGRLDDGERAYGAELLAALAEAWGGEHGLAYAAGALDLVPGHDRAMQLFAFYSAAAGGAADGDALSLRFHAYVAANPDGALAQDGRLHLAASYEALGQVPQAIQVLEPLRGQPDVDVRLAALQRQAQTHAMTPVAGVEDLARSMSDVPDAPDTDEIAEAALSAAPSSQVIKAAALEAARAHVAKSNKAGALEKYLEVLAADPLEPEALSWAEDALRAKRDYAKLRDVLWASARAMSSQDSVESRKLRLREIAGLSESNLRDVDGAIQAWRQLLSLDRGDDAARQALTRALEKAQRWDDLANLYEQEASSSTDVDMKIQLEKKLATLHEQKRSDLLAAAEAWERITALTPDDDHALETSVGLFEKAGRPDRAASLIEERVDGVAEAAARATLLERLGGLREREGATGESAVAAGRAYKRAAEVGPTLSRWSAAERLLAAGETWPLAAEAADRVAELSDGAKDKAAALVRSSEYLRQAGDDVTSTQRLEQAQALAPDVDDYARALMDRYREGSDFTKLGTFLIARGESHADAAVRSASLREAAKLYETTLGDEEAARAQWKRLLDAGEDREALESLLRITEQKGELADAAAFLKRLGALASTPEEKTTLALREAQLLAQTPDGVGPAIERYESILASLDPKCSVALRAIADLETGRGAPKAAAAALERELAMTTEAAARREVSARLVDAYAAAGDDAGTFGALTGLREADPEDFEALNRLVQLAEKLERWEPLVDLLVQQIEVEADENEISTLTRRRAALLADKLGRGDEALAALQEVADAGDSPSRDAYVELGDRLGWRGIVATKLVEWWFPVAASEARTRALGGAFERFAVVGRDGDAVRVGVEILRGSRDAEVAAKLEVLAVKTCDDVGLTAAQEILGLELTGAARAGELVRQAELRVQAKMAWAESVQHGETALGGLSQEEAAPLLARLSALIPEPPAVIDLYERQVSRARGGEAREKALTRAAQIAGSLGDLKRARMFFDLALSGTPSDATIDALAQAAGDVADPTPLRRTLAEALAQGGGGVRDGGRSRANLLRRAATLAERDLKDVDLAFTWLTDALIAHADAAALDALGALAQEVGEPKRIDDVLTRVLTEVFDGPLVRLVLARRAKVRKEVLGDRAGAAVDLKKLHDLSPNDEAVMAELFQLLTEQGDHRAMVQLYEDQILRSKDQAVRAELARKVAQLWDTELADPREAADGWRRVLRLKPGDEEATHGLDRAKAQMLGKKPPDRPAEKTPEKAPEKAPPSPTSSTPTRAAGSTAPPAAVPPQATSSSPMRAAAAPPAATSSTPTRLAPPASSRPLPPALPTADPSGPDTLETRSASGAAPASQETPEAAPVAAVAAPVVVAARTEKPKLESMLGTDPFGDSDEVEMTHTSIDVRIPIAAAQSLDATPQGSAVAPLSNGPSSRRASKPPPLPPGMGEPEHNELPTSPGRRLDALGIGPAYGLANERALGMTDQNPVADFAESAHESSDSKTRSPVVPADVLSVTDLADDDDDDEPHDVLVVDEFVEDGDEFEDVVEPSKPPGPLQT